MYTSIQAYVHSLILVQMTMLPIWIGLWVTQVRYIWQSSWNGILKIRVFYCMEFSFQKEKKKKYRSLINDMYAVFGSETH